jgi:hypothetical protein
MLSDSFNQNAWGKLKEMVSSRFGKEIQIKTLSVTSQSLSFPYMKDDRYIIPIICESQNLGFAIVEDAMNMTLEHKQQVADLVKVILEPAMYSWWLQKKAENLENQLHISDSLNIEKVIEDLQEFSEEPPQVALVSNLIHLSGKNLLHTQKVAMQLHELAHRWAFVSFKEIQSQIQTVEDLKQMGALTLWVEKVEALSPEQQAVFAEFAAEQQGESLPLVIFGSQLGLSELMGSQLNALLIDELSINCLELDKAPLNYPALREVLELFFFQTDRLSDS